MMDKDPNEKPPWQSAPPGESAWERAEREEEAEKFAAFGKRIVPWGVGDAIIVLLAAWLILLAVSLIFGIRFLPPPVGRFTSLLGAIIGYALLFALVWGVAVRLRGGTPSELGFNGFSVLSAAVQAIIWWIVIRAITALYVITLQRLGISPSSAQAERLVRLFGRGFLGLVLALLVAVVIAPFVEELLFRGFVYSAFRQSVGVGWAIFIDGVIFALVHFDLYLFVPLAVIGFVLAWLYERSYSLGPPIFLHALNNLASIIVLYTAASAR